MGFMWDMGSSFFCTAFPIFLAFILIKGIIQGIPRAFVRKYGKQLSSPIHLEVPSGAIWQVELTKRDERVWLQKGWQEFAEHYSLEFGSFLVFRYEGNAHFHVLIFDKSASEIEYPYTGTEGDDDMSVKLCDAVSASRKNKEKLHLPCPQPCKKLRTNSSNRTNSKLEILSSSSSPDDPNTRRIKLGNLKKIEKSCCSKGLRQPDVPSLATKGIGGITTRRSVKAEVRSYAQRLTATEKAHAIQTARALTSIKNPVFMVVMRPSYVRYKFSMALPSNFARKFLTVHRGHLTLRNSAGKTWPAKYYRTAENKNPHARLQGGWRAFAKDNNLNVSDICVFELIKLPEILMKVVIYPVVENASKACRLLADGSITGRVKTRSLVSDTEPNFRQSRCPSSSREFKDPRIEENESHSFIEILDDCPLNQKTKMTLASQCSQPCKMMRIDPSASIQVKGIKLEKQRKSVNFQYLTKELGGEFKHSAKVDSGGMSDAQRSLEPDLIGKMQPLTPTEKERACIQASAFKSANPSFTFVMQPSYVLNGSPLHIPNRFSKRYFKKNGEVILRVSDGRTWIIDYKRILISIRANAIFCTKSWRTLKLDNKLKVGDVCVFELIKENGILLEVVIFSAADIANSSSLKLGCNT